MASIFSQLHTGLSGPLIAVFHGDEVIRWPGGDETQAVIVSGAIWVPQNPKQEGSINPQDTFTGTLGIPGEITIAKGDKWVVDGKVFKVITTEEVDPLTGMRDLELVRAERSITSHVDGAVTLVRGLR